MRSRFDEQLFVLNREIIEMGAMCEEAIATASKALMDGNIELASKQKLKKCSIAVYVTRQYTRLLRTRRQDLRS